VDDSWLNLRAGLKKSARHGNYEEVVTIAAGDDCKSMSP
jgi:hypothetical protein